MTSVCAAHPLTPGQQALWLDESVRGRSAVYNVPVAHALTGRISVPALNAALRAVLARHPSLRSHVQVRDGQPVMVTAAEWDIVVQEQDLRSASAAEVEDAASRFAADPLSLSTLPVVRACLLHTGADQALLVLVVHHGCFDSWSVQVLQSDLEEAYASAVAGTSPATEVPAAYEEHRSAIAAAEGTFDEGLRYWADRLAGAPQESTWPHDAARPDLPTHRGATVSFAISPDAARELRALARARRTTPFSVFAASLQLLLARVAQDAGEDDAEVTIGTPVALRDGIAAEGLVGYLANTVVLRRRVRFEESFADLVGRTAKEVRADLAHGAVPFPSVVGRVPSARSANRPALFQVMLVVEDAPEPVLRLEGATGSARHLHTGTAKFDLTFTLVPHEGGYRGTLEYATDLYGAQTAGEITASLVTLLEGAVARPAEPVGLLPVTRTPEPAGQGGDYEPAPAHELFERTVARTPEAIALRWDGGELTYAQLKRAADRLAARLGRNRVVAVCDRRTPELAVALLAVLKSGAGYVPLDPSYPRDRLDYMLRDSGAGLLLRGSRVTDVLTVPDGVRTVGLDDALTGLDTGGDDAVLPAAGADDLGYVIYTSGSTGRPKGVEMPHRALSNLIDWQGRRSGSAPGWNTLQFAAFSFDVAFQEHFSTWASGGTLVLVDEDVRRDPQRLLTYLKDQRVHRVFAPFVALQQLADSARELDVYPQDLREVVTAGEQLQVSEALRAFFTRVPAFLENQYGPSETHVVTGERLSGDPASWPDLPAIGHAVDRTSVTVLDARLQPLPHGVPGEICVAGAALADGYHGRPDLTAERFVTRDGQRLYRTGDFGKVLPDGRIQCLGRRDGQVKVRGFRIELGEIEAQVRRLPGVADAVVVVHEQPGRGKRLMAHCLPQPGAELSPQQMRRALRGVLPDYMLPAGYAVVDGFPLTPSGKVDRKTLTERTTPSGDQAGRASDRGARDGVEFELLDLWGSVLDQQGIGVDDDFFELGGDSFLAVRLVSVLRAHFGVEVSVAELFRSPTVAELARVVRDGGAEEPVGPLVRLQAGDGTAPLYLFPPLAGTVVRYAPLARALGRHRTVYGLQSPGLLPGEEACGSLTEMAEVYIEQMRKVHPGGPWHLGGYSMGGVIALEAARLLRASGEEVGLVGLLDTNPRMDLDPQEDYALRILVTMGLRLDLDLEELRRLEPARRIRTLLEEGIAAGSLPTGYDEDRLQRMLDAYRHNGEALQRHTLRPYDGDVVLFRATDRAADTRPEAPDLGWARQCRHLTIRDTPGTHFTMLDSGNLEVLCSLIDGELEAAR
ncbi:amino acid adenylation domain-containing protein [Streptomyces sp. NPDC059900]|uniref:non-ribosomal peptide synthetase n=1 Tax=Streptomyces sp. NPDC059900 TaxID=3155816 RepID=UPI00343674F0